MASRLWCDWCWHYLLCTSVCREIIWKPHSLRKFNDENSDLLHIWQINRQNKLTFLSRPNKSVMSYHDMGLYVKHLLTAISSPCYCIKHIRLANCAADMNTHRKSWREKYVSFPLDHPNDLWQVLTQCPTAPKCNVMVLGSKTWLHTCIFQIILPGINMLNCNTFPATSTALLCFKCSIKCQSLSSSQDIDIMSISCCCFNSLI